MSTSTESTLPNVFPELPDCTLNGSALIVKNTFIDIQNSGDDCLSEGGSSRVRAKSLPTQTANCEDTANDVTLLSLRNRLLTWNCAQANCNDSSYGLVGEYATDDESVCGIGGGFHHSIANAVDHREGSAEAQYNALNHSQVPLNSAGISDARQRLRERGQACLDQQGEYQGVRDVRLDSSATSSSAASTGVVSQLISYLCCVRPSAKTGAKPCRMPSPNQEAECDEWDHLHSAGDDPADLSCGSSAASAEASEADQELNDFPELSMEMPVGPVAHPSEMTPGTLTTVILRNLPLNYTRDILVQTLNCNSFHGHFDFVYMPMNFGTQTIFGYASINFVTPELAQRFMAEFQGFTRWEVDSSNEAFVEWSGERQGLQGQIDHYRNSAVMHPSVADEAKPIMLQNGDRVAFPAPTEPLKPLRVRLWKKKQAACLQLDQSPADGSQMDAADAVSATKSSGRSRRPKHRGGAKQSSPKAGDETASTNATRYRRRRSTATAKSKE